MQGLRFLAAVAVAVLAWLAIVIVRHPTEARHQATGAAGRQASPQCPRAGDVLTIARNADVTDWYYNLDNPSISAWPLVNFPLVRNNIGATAVEGMAAARVAELLGSHGVRLEGLASTRATLEEAYFRLTRDAAEHRSGPLETTGARR